MKKEQPPLVHPSLRGMKYVIFPRNRYIQHWDNFFLCVLLYYCFSIPYVVGVSGGYRMYANSAWFVVNMLLNVFYFADVIMLFFRAYRGKDGVLVYELRKIARNYFFSWHFVCNMIASIPMQLIILILRGVQDEGETFDDSLMNLLIITQLLKLLRIPRMKGLIETSFAIQRWWEKQNVPRAMFASFIMRLVIIAHFIACLWSFMAFVQVGSLDDRLAEEPNWISNWYYSSYVEGGINPIGWENDIDRYALSLFWSIQTITSIGYGNIVPVTRAEYYVANVIQICAGLFWAFVIGNLVSIVGHMDSNRADYKRQLDELNMVIKSFSPKSLDEADDLADIGVGDADVVAQRLRTFVNAQYHGKLISRPATVGHSPTLDEVFPALESLSPELRRLTSLHIMRKYLEMIPYFSHKYLSPKEQSVLAFKCQILEFSAGESFTNHAIHGRGLMIVRRGYCLSMRMVPDARFAMHGTDDPIAVDQVLVEDGFLRNLPRYRFISYALVVFIPRSVICEVLNAQEAAWKECARWRYLRTCLFQWAREINGGRCCDGEGPLDA